MSKMVRLASEKTWLIEKFRISQLFLVSVQSNFNIVENDSVLQFSVLMRVLWYVTRLYLKRIFFQTLRQGIPNFEVKIFNKYTIQKKKEKNVFKSPDLRLSSALRNGIFKTKMPHPNVHALYVYSYVFALKIEKLISYLTL